MFVVTPDIPKEPSVLKGIKIVSTKKSDGLVVNSELYCAKIVGCNGVHRRIFFYSFEEMSYALE